MTDNKISTPSSSTGIIRFYDVKSSNVQVEPQIVVAGVVLFILLILLVQTFKIF
ncbi:MAG TPA: preprotein translocase subunit Sec61beta [Candidatus Norongarragalinales archaeon]|nr:preprotein translocase subunit Sec61beta [Candidatus Norongarragalinales archaeon]